MQFLRGLRKPLWRLLIYTYKTWNVSVCLCVICFPKPPNVPGAWHFGFRPYLDQLKSLRSPIFEILILKGGGNVPYGPVLKLAIWLFTLISAIWGPMLMKIWRRAYCLVPSNMKKNTRYILKIKILEAFFCMLEGTQKIVLEPNIHEPRFWNGLY